LTRHRHLLVVGAAALTLSAFAVATPSSADDSGAQIYRQNCAQCHGSDGRGNGPEVNAIPGIKPADLTLLSKRHGGQFPFQEVEDWIDGRKSIPSHKRFDMPFWGVNLQEPGKEFTPESEAKVKARIDAVVRYIQSIQRE
jgi:mono/diheme cytochrome c family protein